MVAPRLTVEYKSTNNNNMITIFAIHTGITEQRATIELQDNARLCVNKDTKKKKRRV
jgi:hypothetical protein